MNRILWAWTVALGVCVTGCRQQPAASGAQESAPTRAQVLERYGKLPMSFEANLGQAEAAARFVTRGAGYTVALTDEGAILALTAPGAGDADPQRQPVRKGIAVALRPVGARTGVVPEGVDPLEHPTSYFVGRQQAEWRSEIPSFAKVRYPDVYPGVDLVFYGNQRQLEFDFVVAPGADPAPLAFRIDGADGVSVDPDGHLRLALEGGEVRLLRPRVYQEVHGDRRPVTGRYELDRDGVVHVRLGTFDRRRPVVIDPLLVYSTYLGANGSGDRALAIAVDSAGYAYVAGGAGLYFPVTPGAFQTAWTNAFVAKLNPQGNGLVYSTYLGGVTNNTEIDGIALDGAGNVYATGFTYCTDFPVTPGAYKTTPTNIGSAAETFVAKLNPSGTALVYATYLGGSGAEFPSGIAVDAQGRAVVTGYTTSTDFPTLFAIKSSCPSCSSNSQDVFVTELNAAGTGLVYSTYLGGSGDENTLFSAFARQPGAITVDAAGNAYVVGSTWSSDFPAVNAFQGSSQGSIDAFVAKIVPPTTVTSDAGTTTTGATLAFSTYLGGTGSEAAFGVALDGAGNIFVAGSTTSTTLYPFQTPSQSTYGGGTDAFVAKLSPSGALLASTYLGGSGDEWAYAVAVDSAGNPVVVGSTTSTNFPVASDTPAKGALEDAFVTKLTADLSGMLLSGFVGGSGSDKALAVAVDSAGAPYLAGSTTSTNLPVVNAYQPYGGGSATDVFISKVSGTALDLFLTPSVRTRVVAQGGLATFPVSASGSSPITLSVGGLPTGATGTFAASPIPAGSATTLTVATLPTTPAGKYTLTLTGTDGARTSSATVTLIVTAPVPDAIVNGGFETGSLSGWSSAGTASVGSPANSGSYAAVLGSSTAFTLDSTLSQTFTVPASGATLGYAYLGGCADPAVDYAAVQLTDNVTGVTTALLDRACNTAAGGWIRKAHDLAAFAGHSVTLTLVNHEAGSGSATSTLFDDVTLIAPRDFALSITPANQSVQSNATASYAVSVSGVGTVSLSTSNPPPNSTITWPAPIPAGSSGTMTATTTSPVGAYPFTVVGTDSSTQVSHAVPVTLTIIPPPPPPDLHNFAISLSPTSQTLPSSGTATYTVNTSGTGTINLSVGDMPTNSTIQFPGPITAGNSGNLYFSTSTLGAGTYPFTVIGTDPSTGETHSVTAQIIVPPRYTVNLNPATQTVRAGTTATVGVTFSVPGAGGQYVVNLSSSGLPPGTASFSQTQVSTISSSSLSVNTTTLSGTYPITVSATNTSTGEVESATVQLIVVPEFSMTVSPASQSVANGLSASYSVAIGGGGTVGLSVSGLPSGATATFSPASVAAGSASTLTVSTLSSTPLGTYTLTINGVNGPVSHSATAQLTVANFTVSATPASQTVLNGNTASFDVRTTGAGTLNLSVSGLPSNTTAAFSPVTVTAGGSSTLSVATNASTTPAGTYPLTITATNSATGVSQTFSAQLVITDFSVSVSPSIQYVVYGNAASYTVSTTGVGTLNLSVAGLPSGASATLSPATVTAGGTSTLTVTTSGTTPVGTFGLVVTATNPATGVSHAASPQLRVSPPSNFTLNVSPTSKGVLAGGSASYGVSISGTGTAALSVSGLPAGASATFSPTSVSAGGSSTLTVTTSASTPVGLYTLTVMGTDNNTGAVQRVAVQLDVGTFVLSTTTSGLSLLDGSYGGCTINTSGAGAISFSTSGLPANTLASFSPKSVTAGASTSYSLYLGAYTPPGTYTVYVTGTNASGESHTLAVPLTVTDFSMWASPTSATVYDGSSGSYSLNLSGAGTLNLTVSGLPAGVSASFNPPTLVGGGTANLVVSPGATVPSGTYTLTATATNAVTGATHSVPLQLTVIDFALSPATTSQSVVAGNTASYTVFTYGAGPLSLSTSGLPAGVTASFSPASVNAGSTFTLTLSTSVNTVGGTYPFTLTATNTTTGSSHSVALQLVVTDFTVSASPSSRTVGAGSAASFTVSTGGVGTVSLSASNLPAGTTASFSPTSVTAGGTSTLTLSTSASTLAGTYTITVTGTNTVTGASHSTTVALSVTDFTVSVSPSSQSVSQGSAASYTVTTTGNVPLNLTVSGVPAGSTATLSPASLASGGTSTLTVSAGTTTPAGTYSLTVTATNSVTGVSHSASVLLTVTDFTISATPPSQTVTQGSAAQYTVSTSGVGTLNLTVSGVPTGATASLSPASVTAGGTSTLTVTTGSTTPAGTYTLTVTGTNSATGASHSQTVQLVVNGPPGSSGSFSYSAINTNSASQNTTNYNVTLNAGQTLKFGTCTVSGSSGSGDTYLRLYGVDGVTLVAYNDDSCGLLSYVSYTATQSGTYQIRAGCFANNSCSGTVAYTIQ